MISPWTPAALRAQMSAVVPLDTSEMWQPPPIRLASSRSSCSTSGPRFVYQPLELICSRWGRKASKGNGVGFDIRIRNNFVARSGRGSFILNLAPDYLSKQQVADADACTAPDFCSLVKPR